MEQMYYRGKALVVGNDHYDQVKPDLDNAVSDAKSIYEAFKDLGFMMMPEAYNIEVDKWVSPKTQLQVYPLKHIIS